MFIGHFGVALAANKAAPAVSIGTTMFAALVRAAVFGGVYWALRRNARNAAWLAALVLSHWVLDWIVHRPDLPPFPGESQAHGLGLWNSLPATLAIELALFAAGILIYLRGTRARDRTGSMAFRALVAFLAAAYLGAIVGPPPPSPQAAAYSAVAIYLVLPWGWWIDRHREPAAGR